MPEDLLSDVLRQFRLSGALFFDVDASAPWVAQAPPASELASFVLPEAQHVIQYHVVAAGSCWVSLLPETEEPQRLDAGSVVVFPQGDAHVMSSEPGLRSEFDLDVLRKPRPTDLRPLLLTRNSDGPETVRLICGFLGCDVLPFNPLITSLPRMMVVTDGYYANHGWLSNLIGAAIAETRDHRAAGPNVLARLSELIFIEAVRIHAEQLPAETENWLTGLVSPQIGRALSLIHADPARRWTLTLLARDSGVSRTILAERFRAMIGTPPMTYLTNWRMQVASGLLADDANTITAVAPQVGYESEAAFSRAFKRCTGLSPAQWRAAHKRKA
jgi:AraC-like DNA-binding protein